MKAMLEFDLPEEEAAFKKVNSVQALCDVIFEIDMFCRNIIKYGTNQELDRVSLAEGIRSIIYSSDIVYIL